MSLMNIYQLVKEFYTVEAVSAMITGTKYNKLEPMRYSHHRWYQDFSDFRDTFITKFASAIYDYTVMVVAAELRYGYDKASHYIVGYYNSCFSRDDIYKECMIYNANDILRAGIKMFDTSQVTWKNSYGGEKWRQIAKAGLMKDKVSDCIFIDHCVDLSHNNSIYFDKSAGIFYLRDTSLYKTFLDTKRVCSPHQLISFKRGYMLNRLLWRANNLNIIKGWNVDGLLSPDYDETESLLFSYNPVFWGNERLNCSDCTVLEQDYFDEGRERIFDVRRESDFDDRCNCEQCA